MKKRFLALILSLCMLLALLPTGVMADEIDDGGSSSPGTSQEGGGSSGSSSEEEPKEDPDPDPTKDPDPDPAPNPTKDPEPTDTPEPTPDPTENVEPTSTPDPTDTPEPTNTPDPSVSPSASPSVSPSTSPSPSVPPSSSPTQTPKSYTVTFDPNGGSGSSIVRTTDSNGRVSSWPSAPTRSGYIFDGWYTKTSGGSEVTESYTFTANTTVYAHWTVNKTYTITFNANGGSVSPASKTTNTNGRLSSLPDPTRSGYTFDGWYTAKSGGSKISTSYTFTSNATIYAHWTAANTFTITFNANGGKVSTTSAVTKNGKLSSLPTPTRSGYSFDGWYTKAKNGTRITTSTVFDENTTVYAHWYDGESYKDSGSHDLSKLSQKEISSLLADAPLTMPENIFSSEPSVTSPYAAGKLTSEALNAALDRLNALRKLAGLPSVKLDNTLNESAQYGAVLLAASEFSHTPAKPSDMDSSFYNKAYSATSSSNIHYGSGGTYANLAYSVDSFMDDSDSSNVNRVGHRRWQLNPEMGKVGFGYAKDGSAGYICEKVFDTSGSDVDYEFIAWPASGNFPEELFDSNAAWSVSVNPELYQTPSRSNISVTLYREDDKKTWTFSGSNYKAASSGKYFTVDTGGYGISNCIIFRPDGVDTYDGVYTVTIEGLRTKAGEEVSLAYQVDFFSINGSYTVTLDANGGSLGTGSSKLTTDKDGKLSSLPTPTRNGYGFSGWYTTKSYGSKVTTDTVFDSNTTIYARWTQTVTVTFDPNGGTVSPTSMTTAADGLLSSLPTPTRSGYGFSGWYTAAQGGALLSTATVFYENTTIYAHWDGTGFQDVPVGMYYTEAVLWAVEQGITKGTSQNVFSPDNSCSRGEIVTFLWRAAGSPKPKNTNNPFTDVQPGSYYYDAVLWAVEQGITTGTSATTFGPNVTVGRDQTVTFLYRAAGSPSIAGETPFVDISEDAYYAAAVCWAVEQGITTGTGKSSFSPGMHCSRGQIVTFLYRAK